MRRLALTLATLCLIVGALAVWADRVALQTDVWTETSVALLEDDDVRAAAANYLAEEAVGALDLERRLDDRLPSVAQPLAPLAAGVVRDRAPAYAEKLLESQPVQDLWREANRRSHARLVTLLTDETAGNAIVRREGGTVTLDLQPIADRLRERLGIGTRLGFTLPPTAARLEILSSDEVEQAQTAARLLQVLAWVLPVLALVLYAVAVWRTPAGRRARTVVTAGLLVALAGLLVLAARRLLAGVVVDQLAQPGSSGVAALRVWEIGTDLLRTSALGLVALGLLVAAAGWLATQGRRARALRTRLAPVLREEPALAYGAVVAVFAVLVAWAPVPALRTLAGALLVLGLLLAWVAALRHQVRAASP